MSAASVWASLVVIIVSVLVLALPWLLSHLRRLAHRRDLWQEGAYPVFSAETTEGREAEYINERLLPKVPRWGKLLASFLLILAVAYLVAGQWPARP